MWGPQPVQIDTALGRLVRGRLGDAPLMAAVGASLGLIAPGLIAASQWVFSPLSLALLGRLAAWRATTLDLRVSIGCITEAVSAATVEVVDAQGNEAAAELAPDAASGGTALLGAPPDGGLVRIPPGVGHGRRDFLIQPTTAFSFSGAGDSVVLVPLLDDGPLPDRIPP